MIDTTIPIKDASLITKHRRIKDEGDDGITPYNAEHPDQRAALIAVLKSGALLAAGVTTVSGTFAATGASAAFSPVAGRDFNVTIDGTFQAAIQIERSFDSGTTWHVVLTDALRRGIPPSFTQNESEVGVQYRLNCTSYTSGSVVYRVSQ